MRGAAAEGTQPAEARAAEPAWHRLLRWGLLALPVVVLAERAWAERWVTDDGFIYLRVVRQVLAGNGPVFNGGERVEAATSPAWVAVLAASDVLTPIRLEWLAVLVGIGLTLAGLSFAIAGARALSRPRKPGELYVPAGAAVVLAVAPAWILASAGLEGGLTFAWIGACLWAVAVWARAGDPLHWSIAVLVGLGPLIRPELGMLTVLLLAAVLIGRGGRDRWGDRARLLALAFALPCAYQLFRMGYYDSLVPNPGIAKEATSSRWDQGWTYLSQAVEPYVLWLPLLTLALGAYLPQARELRLAGRARALLVVAAFVVGGLLHVLYIVRVGGDFFHARLLFPGLIMLCAPVAVVPLRREYLGSLLVLPWAVVAILFLRSDFDRYDKGGIGTRNPVTVEDFGWGEDGPKRAWFQGAGVYFSNAKLPAAPPPGLEVVSADYGIGLVSYALGPDVYVLDLLGLADPFTAHLEIERRGLPAHEKPLPAPWVAARITAPGSSVDEHAFPLLIYGTAPLGHAGNQSFDARVARARATLRCAEMRDFFDGYRGSLTIGRFFSNVVDAFGNTRMRIPPEPRDAYKRFCGRQPR